MLYYFYLNPKYSTLQHIGNTSILFEILNIKNTAQYYQRRVYKLVTYTLHPCTQEERKTKERNIENGYGDIALTQTSTRNR